MCLILCYNKIVFVLTFLVSCFFDVKTCSLSNVHLQFSSESGESKWLQHHFVTMVTYHVLTIIYNNSFKKMKKHLYSHFYSRGPQSALEKIHTLKYTNRDTNIVSSTKTMPKRNSEMISVILQISCSNNTH